MTELQRKIHTELRQKAEQVRVLLGVIAHQEYVPTSESLSEMERLTSLAADQAQYAADLAAQMLEEDPEEPIADRAPPQMTPGHLGNRVFQRHPGDYCGGVPHR